MRITGLFLALAVYSGAAVAEAVPFHGGFAFGIPATLFSAIIAFTIVHGQVWESGLVVRGGGQFLASVPCDANGNPLPVSR